MSLTTSNDLRPAYIEAAEQLRSNKGQWDVYESTQNCVVLAGPGSGKTKVLTIKMARMLTEDVREPQGVACITYSNECARELKSRLDKLGIEERKTVYIGTIHSFCLSHIVQPYAALAGMTVPQPIKVADSKTWEKLYIEAVAEVGVRDKKNLKTRFEKYRHTYIDRESEQWKKESVELSNLIECFEAKLHKSGMIDFDDMVLFGLSLIKNNEWVRKAIHARYPIFLIDEYQDLGLALHEIVLNLGFKAVCQVLCNLDGAG